MDQQRRSVQSNHDEQFRYHGATSSHSMNIVPSQKNHIGRGCISMKQHAEDSHLQLEKESSPKRRVSPRSHSKKIEPIKVTRTAKAAKPSVKPTKINSAAKKVAKSKRTNKPNLKIVLDSKWNLRFNEMCEYKRTNRNCLVPKQFKEKALASW